MADLQQQLQAILGDPQTMGQITAIAQALGGSGAAPPQEGDPAFVPTEAGEAPPEGGSPDLSALTAGLDLSELDPRLLQIALQAFSAYTSSDDRKLALLSALKPFLREERLEKLEKAEKLSRLSRVIQTALQAVKEGEMHV